ncbi:MAG: bifunctional nicotinamidase/pyrazinamidase, partial [Sedimentisphaerales bacterium]|nr:bifunctional nicotinamidase/pyrazinamidase [Sedimentisphaerales bacterium]
MRALLVVDIQNDFAPGGALAVPDGDQVVPVANRLVKSKEYDLIVATQDWHPSDHMSFASQHLGKKPGDIIELDGLEQILWPDHCIQHSYGARFVKRLESDHIHRIFHKGTDRWIDSYSGFFDNGHRKSTGLAEYLREHSVDQVHIIGLATDY